MNNEYTAELYYRYQLTQLFSITPDMQYLVNHALNPDEENVLVVGLCGRLSFRATGSDGEIWNSADTLQ